MGSAVERFLAILATVLVAAGVFAADQTVIGQGFLVKDPGTVTRRKIVVQARERPTDDSVVGDPRVGGATLTVSLDGASPSVQTFTLPAAGWRVVRGGYAFKSTVGVVRTAVVRRSGASFQVKASGTGKSGTLDLVPPDPATSACARLAIDGGDAYHVLFAPASDVRRNDAQAFVVRSSASEGLCPDSDTTTTTTTSTSITTSTTTTTNTTTTVATSTTTSTSLHLPTTTTTSTSTSLPVSTTSSTVTTTTTTAPPTQCCLPGSPAGAFICAEESAADCAAAGGLDFGPGACAPSPCPTLPPTTTTSSTTSTTTTTTSTTVPLCAAHGFQFTMTSTTGGLVSDAHWPGGQDTQCASPGCCVTVGRPSGDVVLVGSLGDHWTVAGVSGFSSCTLTGGCATNGGTCTSCNGVDAPTSCPLFGIPNCTGNRPSCSAGLNGSATDTAHVQCAP